MKHLVTILLVACLLPLSIHAQDTEAKKDTVGGLTVRTNPSSANVQVKGPVMLRGISPTIFHQRLAGDYKVIARKYMFEPRSVHVMLEPGNMRILDLDLKPKTRLKAVLRSAFVPGWGQHYTEQHAKGYLANVLAVGSVIGYFVADNSYRDKYNTYKDARARYDLARRQEAASDDLDSLYRIYQSAQKSARSAEDTRRAMIGVVAGIWALNLADAFIFFPNEKGVEVQGVNVSPSASLGSIGISVSKSF